jgi:geranylgeranyl reductase family protein
MDATFADVNLYQVADVRIAIVGAGPAGAMAAVRLARAGAAVSLFDPSHPREKPCGGGLTGRALALVNDVIDLRTLPAVVVTSATVEGPERAARVALIDRGVTSDSSLIVLSRAVFDRALADAAVASGAHLIPEKAIDVSGHHGRMIVRTARRAHDADFVLGADGANSIVRKKLARPFGRAELSVAAGVFVHDATASTIALKTTCEQPGYLWSFPRPDHLAVGVCAAATHRATSGDLRTQTAAWIAQHGLDSRTRLTPYAWPIPSIGFQHRDDVMLGGDGWMLLGDAAGLVDPLTREGIYFALVSGQWAADALAAGPQPAARYANRVLHDVHPELARAARLSRLFFTPAFSSLFVRALDRSEAIREVFVDLVSGIQPYRGLRRRLLVTREWTLAARAIQMLLRPAFTGTMNAVALPRKI